MTFSRRTRFAVGAFIVFVPTSVALLAAEVGEVQDGDHATGLFALAIAGGIVAGFALGRFDERASGSDGLTPAGIVALVVAMSAVSLGVRVAEGDARTVLFGALGALGLTTYGFLVKATREGRYPPPLAEPAEHSLARPRSRALLWSTVAAGVVGFGVLVGASEKDVSTGIGGAIIAAGAVVVVSVVVWLLRRLFGGGRAI